MTTFPQSFITGASLVMAAIAVVVSCLALGENYLLRERITKLEERNENAAP